MAKEQRYRVTIGASHWGKCWRPGRSVNLPSGCRQNSDPNTSQSSDSIEFKSYTCTNSHFNNQWRAISTQATNPIHFNLLSFYLHPPTWLYKSRYFICLDWSEINLQDRRNSWMVSRSGTKIRVDECPERVHALLISDDFEDIGDSLSGTGVGRVRKD